MNFLYIILAALILTNFVSCDQSASTDPADLGGGSSSSTASSPAYSLAAQQFSSEYTYVIPDTLQQKILSGIYRDTIVAVRIDSIISYDSVSYTLLNRWSRCYGTILEIDTMTPAVRNYTKSNTRLNIKYDDCHVWSYSGSSAVLQGDYSTSDWYTEDLTMPGCDPSKISPQVTKNMESPIDQTQNLVISENEIILTVTRYVNCYIMDVQNISKLDSDSELIDCNTLRQDLGNGLFSINSYQSDAVTQMSTEVSTISYKEHSCSETKLKSTVKSYVPPDVCISDTDTPERDALLSCFKNLIVDYCSENSVHTSAYALTICGQGTWKN